MEVKIEILNEKAKEETLPLIVAFFSITQALFLIGDIVSRLRVVVPYRSYEIVKLLEVIIALRNEWGIITKKLERKMSRRFIVRFLFIYGHLY